MAYCVAADLYKYGGLTRGALASPGHLVGSVSATSNAFELDGHGFDDDTTLQFRAVGGGTLPSPIVAGTTYYAIVVDAWHFQVASAAGGDAIDLTTAGTTFQVFSPLSISDALDAASRMIDDMLPAHLVPLTAPYAEIITITTAQLAGSMLLALTGNASASLTASVYDEARKRIDAWGRGKPVRGTNAPGTSQKSVGVATSRTLSDWKRFGGIA